MQVNVSTRLVSHYGELCCLAACHWPSVLAAMLQATHSRSGTHLTQSTRCTTLNSLSDCQPEYRDYWDGSPRQQSVRALRGFGRELASSEQTSSRPFCQPISQSGCGRLECLEGGEEARRSCSATTASSRTRSTRHQRSD
jgi:hypothetical protein